jgi:cytochrome c-type protein NapC
MCRPLPRIRGWLSQQPVSRFVFGGLLIAGFAGGILFWGGYNWAMELSNEEAFCISCHEMQERLPRVQGNHSLQQPHRRAHQLL